VTTTEGLLTAILAVQGEAPTLAKNATNPQRDKHRNPLDACPDCGGSKLKRAKRCKACSSKARIGEIRTDTPSPSTGRYRARRARPVQRCEYPGCEVLGIDRHHIDEDTANNDPSNIAVYCRRHHMTVDGRLAAAAARAPVIAKLGGRRKAES
jgi:predicted  nucleic acid-binding Zn-ribbon protein